MADDQQRPDPRAATTVDEFLQVLRRLRIWAGNPSLATLAKRTGRPRTTLHDAMRPGRTGLPGRDLVLRLVAACGCPPGEVEAWERAWRQVQERISVEAPQARQAGLVPRQLPAADHGFIGREAELHGIDALLEDPPPAVVICGTGGVGKTALAVRWAHRVSDRFPDGQIYLNLGGFSNRPPLPAADALALILAALGVADEEIPTGSDALAGLCRSLLSGRRLLLVLDNADNAEQVRPLLPGEGTCFTVVTSRNALTGLIVREGAQRVRLHPLDDAQALRLLSRSLGADRVSREERSAIRLARLCGRLPLALRIAAANLADRSYWTIGGYAGELATGDRLSILALPGDGDSSVGVVMLTSYQKLDPQARQLFRRLGLVPGATFTGHAAAVLTDDPPDRALAVLETLASAHLVEAVGPRLFTLHDLVRLFARRLADEAEPDPAAVLAALLQWYLRTTINAVEVLRPKVVRLPDRPGPAVGPLSFPDAASAREWLDAERGNLVDAIAAARGHEQLRHYAWLIADALRGYFSLRVPRVQRLAAAEAGLDAAQLAGDLEAQAAMRACLGDAAWAADDYAEAVVQFTIGLELAGAAGDRTRAAALMSNLGLTHFEAGDLGSAAQWLTRAVEAYRSIGDKTRAATGLARLGSLHRDQGLLELAEGHLRQAIAWHREGGDRYQVADALARLGIVLRYRGLVVEAVLCAEEAHEIYQEVGDRVGIACTLEDLAAARVEAGEAEPALRAGAAALELAREIGDRRVESDALATLGAAQDQSGVPGAAGNVREALRIADDNGYKRTGISARLTLAGILLREGSVAQARAQVDQALAGCRQAGFRLLEGRCLTALAAVLLAAGETVEGIAAGSEALTMHAGSGQLLASARTAALLTSHAQGHGS